MMPLLGNYIYIYTDTHYVGAYNALILGLVIVISEED